MHTGISLYSEWMRRIGVHRQPQGPESHGQTSPQHCHLHCCRGINEQCIVMARASPPVTNSMDTLMLHTTNTREVAGIPPIPERLLGVWKVATAAVWIVIMGEGWACCMHLSWDAAACTQILELAIWGCARQLDLDRHVSLLVISIMKTHKDRVSTYETFW